MTVLQKLNDSEIRYRRLFEAAQDGILILDAATGLIEDVNPFLIKMLGYSREELVEKKLWEVGAFRDIEASQEAFEALQENEYIRYDDLPLKTKDGRLIQVEFVSNVYLVDDEKVIQCNIRDITERKQAVERTRESNERFQRYFELGLVGMAISSPARLFIAVNSKICEILGYEERELLQRNWAELTYPDDLGRDNANFERVLAGEIDEYSMDKRWIRKDGQLIDSLISVKCVRRADRSVAYFVAILQDISERKRSEARIRRQLEHLTALSAIDRVIAANFDLGLSLAEILLHVTVELGVDAADILILNASAQMLNFGAERGFRTTAVRKAQIRVGESFAGRAALGRQLVQVADLRVEPDHLALAPFLAGEDFIGYYGVPLVAKGQVKGVLEVFHRAALDPDAEWFDFFNSLAGQAAIAIENAMLFESLQRSNSELTLAYDATIEGWSRALDLRDEETEGHTQRVTEMSLKLARAFGFSEAELVQVRWGALLHDIGKLGVPDGILHKPSPLTAEEWVVMKKHPCFAYEMIAPIRYLQLALELPYCHHEKWDGSGYPRGLKGDQIPLVARIFAVADVWDALRSDRPYRAAWTEDKVLEYIRSSAGTHFDPWVVDVFMRIPRKP